MVWRWLFAGNVLTRRKLKVTKWEETDRIKQNIYLVEYNIQLPKLKWPNDLFSLNIVCNTKFPEGFLWNESNCFLKSKVY